MESQNKQIIPYIYAENEVQANVIRLAQRYETMGADELFIYNYATDEASREEFLETARQIDKTIDIPFTIGIYVDRFEDIKKALYTGAKHVVVKEEITENWDAVKEGTDRFGNDKIVVELTCTDEFLTPSEIKKFQNMNIYAVLLKHVDVNERLCENLKHVDMPVIIRDSLKRNDLSELMGLEHVSGVSTNYFENKELMPAKLALKKAGIPVNTFESAIPFSDFVTDCAGLVPCIVQDYKTGEVLMLAYMNEESYGKTIETGKMTYYSRSRQELWCKGDTSGHYQYVKALKIDCDNDTILAEVRQVGAACHTGNRSCFYRELLNRSGDFVNPLTVLTEDYDVIANRKAHPKEGSYTNYLFDKGIDKILKKCGEEATEIVIAAKNPDAEELKYEISDFLYHLMVLMVECGLDWNDIVKELANRRS